MIVQLLKPGKIGFNLIIITYKFVELYTAAPGTLSLKV